MIEKITLIDSLISLFYIVVILLLIRLTKPDKSEVFSKYYSSFFVLKIFLAIFFVLIHSYYYKGGDTFLYFAGGQFFLDQFKASPVHFINILSSSSEELFNIAYTDTFNIFSAIRSNNVLFLSKIIGILSIFTNGQYLATSILFTLITAIGIWKLYVTLCKLHPKLYKLFAVGVLFYPSVGIWGSGILKDPLTFAAVGFIFSATYNLLKKRKILFSVISIFISIYLCFILKPYILYTFIPAMLFWVQGKAVNKNSSPLTKYVLTPILVPIFLGGAYLFLQQVSDGAGKYSLDNVQSVAEGFHSWHSYLAETRNQSGYSLGDVEFTLQGVLLKAPEAFFVAYFRPFIIGDVRNVATLFEAIQSLILLILSIYVFIKVGIFKSFKLILSNADVRAFMLFAVIFGITVGLTSYNFGALSRYKIPGVPFYVASISIIYYLGYLKPKKGYS